MAGQAGSCFPGDVAGRELALPRVEALGVFNGLHEGLQAEGHLFFNAQPIMRKFWPATFGQDGIPKSNDPAVIADSNPALSQAVQDGFSIEVIREDKCRRPWLLDADLFHKHSDSPQ